MLALGILLQLALGLLLGHSTDTRVFMATGHLVGSGQNPYVAQDLTAVFRHVSFDVPSAVGYPPPWPLALGLLYRASYAVVDNLLVYNLVIKLLVIAANVGLAHLVGAILQNLGAPATVSRKAWAFVLFNPLLLYFGAAWGQIDSIVALSALGALVLLWLARRDGSALLLALAFSIKPIALPLLPVALADLSGRSPRQVVRYGSLFLCGTLLLCVAPFFLPGWSAAPILENPNAHFVLRGAMSYMTVVRVFRDLDLFAGRWWLLGLAWIPALAIGVLILMRTEGRARERRLSEGDFSKDRPGSDFTHLLRAGAALVLIVLLTRTWMAEANVILVFPLVLILASLGELDRRLLTALWLLPLLFTFFNASSLHLLWVAFPTDMDRLLADVAPYADTMLAVRAVIVIAWQVVGWWTVVVCLSRGRERTAVEAVAS